MNRNSPTAPVPECSPNASPGDRLGTGGNELQASDADDEFPPSASEVADVRRRLARLLAIGAVRAATSKRSPSPSGEMT